MAEQADSGSAVLLNDTTRVLPPVQSWRMPWPARAWLAVVALAALVVVEAVFARRFVALGSAPAAAVAGAGLLAGALAGALLAGRLVSALSLRYTLGNDTLTISRGMARWVIPLHAIETAYVSEPAAVYTAGLWLPDFSIGRGYVRDGGPALFFTSVPPARAVALRTASRTYLLSPGDASSFVAAVNERRLTAAPAAESAPGESWLAALRQPVSIILALAAAAANVGLFAFVARWRPVLPDLPIHFNAAGSPDRWGPPGAHVWLPTIGAIVLLANIALVTLPGLRRPGIAHLLLGAAVVVQVLLWVAFASILP